MKEKMSAQGKIQFRKYAISLRQEMLSKQPLKKADKEKQEFMKLQDEITAIEDLCREYCRICYQTTTKEPTNETMERALEYIKQLNHIFTTAKAQMISGEISKEHLIEVAQIGKGNLIKICEMLQIKDYADLLLAEETELSQPEER